MINTVKIVNKIFAVLTVIFSMCLISVSSFAQEDSASCSLNKPFEQHSLNQQKDFYNNCIKPTIINAFDVAQYSQINDYSQWLKASAVPHLTQSGVYQQTFTNENAYETYTAFDNSQLPQESILVTENFQIAENGEVNPQSLQVIVRHADERDSETGQTQEVWEFMQFNADGQMQTFDNLAAMCPEASYAQECFEVPHQEALLH